MVAIRQERTNSYNNCAHTEQQTQSGLSQGQQKHFGPAQEIILSKKQAVILSRSLVFSLERCSWYIGIIELLTGQAPTLRWMESGCEASVRGGYLGDTRYYPEPIVSAPRLEWALENLCTKISRTCTRKLQETPWEDYFSDLAIRNARQQVLDYCLASRSAASQQRSQSSGSRRKRCRQKGDQA